MRVRTLRPRTLRALTAAAAVLISAAVVAQASEAAFTTTTGGTAGVGTGGISLSAATPSGVSLMTLGNLAPGATGTRCEVVTYTGTLPATVTTFASATAGNLASHLQLSITEGRGTNTACTDFVPDSVLWSGTVADFGAQVASDATGVGFFTPERTGQTRTYRFVWTLPATVPNSTQGTNATLSLRWQASQAGRSVLRAQGRNEQFQLGLGYTGSQGSPQLVADPSPETGGWTDLSHAELASCAVRGDGTLWCWGWNGGHRIGLPSNDTSYPAPTRVGVATDWVAVALAIDGGCAIKVDRSLWCWGSGPANGLGGGTVAAPTKVGSAQWLDVAADVGAACGVRANNTLWCWGDGRSGRTGHGDNYVERSTPVRVGSDFNWRTVSVGDLTTCGIRLDDSLWCWGRNNEAQTGTGLGPSDVLTPAAVSPGTRWAVAAPSTAHSCGIQIDGGLWCWGAGSQVGQADPNYQRDTPQRVGTGRWSTVAAYWYFSCAVRADRTLWCWGTSNGDGQQGSGGGLEPTQVPGVSAAGLSQGSYVDHTVFRTWPR